MQLRHCWALCRRPSCTSMQLVGAARGVRELHGALAAGGQQAGVATLRVALLLQRPWVHRRHSLQQPRNGGGVGCSRPAMQSMLVQLRVTKGRSRGAAWPLWPGEPPPLACASSSGSRGSSRAVKHCTPSACGAADGQETDTPCAALTSRRAGIQPPGPDTAAGGPVPWRECVLCTGQQVENPQAALCRSSPWRAG